MRFRLFSWFDDTAHALTHAGLMPRALGMWICDRYDAWLLRGAPD